MQIEDGTGSGKTLQIDNQNRLQAYSVIENEATYENEKNGAAYELPIFLTPDTPNPSIHGDIDACFCYIKNTNNSNMILTEIRCWAESNEYIDIYLKDTGTPVGGTKMTPINMNLGSGNVADGTFLTGEMITGISGGTLFDRLRIPADNSDHIFSWLSHLIIPKNNIITLYAGNGNIPIEISIQLYYHI